MGREERLEETTDLARGMTESDNCVLLVTFHIKVEYLHGSN